MLKMKEGWEIVFLWSKLEYFPNSPLTYITNGEGREEPPYLPKASEIKKSPLGEPEDLFSRLRRAQWTSIWHTLEKFGSERTWWNFLSGVSDALLPPTEQRCPFPMDQMSETYGRSGIWGHLKSQLSPREFLHKASWPQQEKIWVDHHMQKPQGCLKQPSGGDALLTKDRHDSNGIIWVIEIS